MSSGFIPVNRPRLEGREVEYVQDCLRSGWISSEGPYVERFEAAMAAACGRRFGVAMSNGSVALDLAVAALDLGPGDEVILPTFTIVSCAAAIVRAGATMAVVDCDPETYNMTAEGVAAAITPRTRAIMIVHLYGLPVDLDPILALAERHGLKVIEDAAEMHGQTYRGRPCGSFGDISTLSFYPNKHVTTGEGGMALTDDPFLAERLRSLRNLCFQPGRRFVHEELGWNARMSNIQAALGLAQVERLDEAVLRKRQIGARYREALGNERCIALPPASTHYADNIYWVFGLVLNDEVGLDAAGVMKALEKHGIGSRPFFWCLHEQPVFLKRGWFEGDRHPHAERIARRGFYLPSGLGIEDEEIDRSVTALQAVLDERV